MPPRLPRPQLPTPNQSFSLRPHYQCLRVPARQFSSTPHYGTRLRRDMYRWINGPGAVFKDPLPGATNYLNAYTADGKLIRTIEAARNRGKPGKEAEHAEESDDKMNFASGEPIPVELADDLVPFPLNTNFMSQRVLSDELRDEVYRRVVVEGKSVRVVSSELGIEMSRIGAVVRLKSVEEEWVKEGKPLAIPYARAVLDMLPKTPLSQNTKHESINDLPVHKATLTQIFHPVSESRHFTRKDAGEVFFPGLLPADQRIPHPELIELEKWDIEGMVSQERVTKMREKMKEQVLRKEACEEGKRAKEERAVTKINTEGGRWEFRFRDISVEDVGRTGRDKRGVGARYGIPHEDRKRGQIKIPTRVE